MKKVIKNEEYYPFISDMILKCMDRAYYSNKNTGHFALANNSYTHFTSPIRRYPDLYIHRIISKYIQTNYNPSEEFIEIQKELAVKNALQSSEREKTAQKAEREADDLKKAEYMQDRIGEVYEGIISSVTNFGLFVELDNTVEGLIRFENLGNEYFEYDEDRKQLIGENSRKIYKIGDKITVQVIEANKILRKVAFAKYEEEK